MEMSGSGDCPAILLNTSVLIMLGLFCRPNIRPNVGPNINDMHVRYHVTFMLGLEIRPNMAQLLCTKAFQPIM